MLTLPDPPWRLDWPTRDPDTVLDWLRAAGLPVTGDRLGLPAISVVVHAIAPGVLLVRPTLATDRDRSLMGEPWPGPLGRLDAIAVGWATVDLERAAVASGRHFAPADPDAHLGAHAFADLSTGPGPAFALLEPNTEGRLAATLVRHGEGPAVLYLATPDRTLESVVSVIRRAGGRTSAEADGPFGRSVLVLGGPIDGPHILIVDGAGDSVAGAASR